MAKIIDLNKLCADTRDAIEYYGEITQACPCHRTDCLNKLVKPYCDLPITLLNEKEVARLLPYGESTLQKWRYKKDYRLPWVKIEDRVFYRFCDVVKFINDHIVVANDN